MPIPHPLTSDTVELRESLFTFSIRERNVFFISEFLFYSSWFVLADAIEHISAKKTFHVHAVSSFRLG